MNKVMFLNLYVDICAANLCPSVTSPSPGVWPAELTLHLPAALACCLLRQEGILSVRPFFVLDAPRSLSASSGTSAWLALLHPQLTAVQGSLSPFRGDIASVRVFVFQVDTPLNSLLPWMYLYISSVHFPSHRPLNCSCKPHLLLSPLKVLLHLLPMPPSQPIFLSLPLGLEPFNPPCLALLLSASPWLSTFSLLC